MSPIDANIAVFLPDLGLPVLGNTALLDGDLLLLGIALLVRVPRCNPYPNAGGNWDHGLTDRSTAHTSPGEASAVMRTIARRTPQ